jgi:DNA replication ATP-dependent helicase Dna2
VIPLLTGEAEDGVDAEEFDGVHGELTDAGKWEEQQTDAIAACVAAPWHRLVQGPPGTGKTHVLAEVVRRLVEKGERVFLTSLTHRAIDHALHGVARALGGSSRCARIGVPMHRGPDELPIYGDFGSCPLAGRSGGYVVAATPFVLSSRIKGVDFDTVVIDEAGQVMVPLAVMAMVRARKFLFFGDDCQLGPVVQSLSRREARETGIFQKLQRHDPVRLNVTYRLNETLAHWPSENFYHGDLTPAPPAAQRRLAWQAPAGLDPWIAQVLDPAHALTWLAVKHHGALTTSPDEAGAAAEVLEALTAGGVRHGEIAVVVPFRLQARRLRKRLRGDAWRHVVIDTVERMQGQEREVVLLSLTGSDLPSLQRIGDFFFDPRRLTVAATRARTKLVILASPDLLRFSTFDTDLAEDAAVLHSLLKAAVRIDYPHTISHE